MYLGRSSIYRFLRRDFEAHFSYAFLAAFCRYSSGCILDMGSLASFVHDSCDSPCIFSSQNRFFPFTSVIDTFFSFFPSCPFSICSGHITTPRHHHTAIKFFNHIIKQTNHLKGTKIIEKLPQPHKTTLPYHENTSLRISNPVRDTSGEIMSANIKIVTKKLPRNRLEDMRDDEIKGRR